MLDGIRANAQSWGVKLAFGIIIVVFVFWGIGSYTGPKGLVASVNGRNITEVEFQRAYAMMEDNVLRHEPHIALFVPDDNPLLFYEAIATYSIDHLQPHGKLYFECNREHAYDVAEMLVQTGFRNIVTLRDAFGNLRFVKAVAKDKAGVSSSSL